MDFEWNEDKRLSNIEKHKVDILEALLIFENWVLTEPDTRYDYGEARYISTGMIDGHCYVLIHTERAGRVRLISARQGGRRDRRKYQAGYARRDPGNEG